MSDRTSETHSVEHEEAGAKGAFFIQQDGQRLGTLTYSRTTPTLIILDHTAVSDKARGRGVGRALVEGVVVWARETGTRIIPLCPFARSVFDAHESLRDVLSD